MNNFFSNLLSKVMNWSGPEAGSFKRFFSAECNILQALSAIINQLRIFKLIAPGSQMRYKIDSI
ncbi:hypothetical protein BpHYR1_003893 [Brachionus plicatilis]|uniref:Uncharacterized protein n=1 Tax=Brachionus plicatilis TaxID=10195 RepID=A0A3M7PIW5_BRAPC|nr:hypothetical protein BpHYR1_003893 [Brachionus plicatilis]